MEELYGILPVYKPRGCTSFDVVRQIRRIFGQKRVGHTGTLDPEVDGVLPICLGQATRVVEYLQEMPKRYIGSMKLGVATDTEDQTGEITCLKPVKEISREQVDEVFHSFIGEIEQIPPMYSAVRVKGQRLYDLARQGVEVNRSPRRVQIYSLACTGFEMYPQSQIAFEVECSKGTYVRTLCVDIGQRLGYPAHMDNLTRVQSGPFHMEDCFTLEELQRLRQEGNLQEALVSIDEALGILPSLFVSDEDMSGVLNGCWLEGEILPGLYRVYSLSGRFCGIYCTDEEVGVARPEKVFRDVED